MNITAVGPSGTGGEVAGRVGRYRWVICALLFFATTINYIDRQVLGILAPLLQQEIGWNEIQYGYIVTAFQAAYAIGLLVVGRLIDRYGTKLGYSIAIVLWSLAAMAHAVTRSASGFGAARFALGLGESANFPAAVKAIAEWFPKKERAFATGVFNSGANIGAVVAPLAVPFLTVMYGWQSAFIVTGLLGFVWLVFWLLIYERPETHRKLSRAELGFIRSDPPDPSSGRIPWASLLRYRQTWAFVAGKFLTDPIWWFYLYWLPKFLNKTYGLTLTDLGLPLVVIYTMTSIGSIGGGWLSSRFISRGWPVGKARKTVMLICALLIVPIVATATVANLWVAVALIGIAAAAHQGWSANLFTTASDMFPRDAVGSVVGLGGMAGAVGGMLLATSAGFLLEWTGSYMTLFIISGSVYLLALFIFNLLVPDLEPAAITSRVSNARTDNEP
jgi:ACS family hexuronate transporter-like MFS transporter